MFSVICECRGLPRGGVLVDLSVFPQFRQVALSERRQDLKNLHMQVPKKGRGVENPRKRRVLAKNAAERGMLDDPSGLRSAGGRDQYPRA
jgi:hypothetical protein